MSSVVELRLRATQNFAYPISNESSKPSAEFGRGRRSVIRRAHQTNAVRLESWRAAQSLDRKRVCVPFLRRTRGRQTDAATLSYRDLNRRAKTKVAAGIWGIEFKAFGSGPTRRRVFCRQVARKHCGAMGWAVDGRFKRRGTKCPARRAAFRNRAAIGFIAAGETPRSPAIVSVRAFAERLGARLDPQEKSSSISPGPRDRTPSRPTPG